MPNYQILFYEKEDGTRPAEEYIHSISPKMVARLYKAINVLADYGSQARMPYSEYLQDGIFQVRAQQEGNISRVLYFFAVGKTIILTNCFTKKTPKTPPEEIERAKRYRADYLRREEEQR